MKVQHHSLLPLMAVLGTVILWASAYPSIAIALQGFSPAPLAAIRFAFASLALVGIALLTGVGLPQRSDLPRILAIALVGIAIYNLLLNLGQTSVNAGTAGLLINVNPVIAAVLARVFLDERLRLIGWVGIAVAFTGAAIIATGRTEAGVEFGWGALYILGAAFCFALQWVLQKPLLSRYRPLSVATWVIWAGTAMLAPFLATAIGELQAAPPHSVLAMLYLGVGPAALAYAIWAYALAHFPVGRATSFLYLVAPVALGLAYVLLGEIPSITVLAGGVLTLVGVIMVNTFGRVAGAARPNVSAAKTNPVRT